MGQQTKGVVRPKPPPALHAFFKGSEGVGEGGACHGWTGRQTDKTDPHRSVHETKNELLFCDKARLCQGKRFWNQRKIIREFARPRKFWRNWNKWRNLEWRATQDDKISVIRVKVDCFRSFQREKEETAGAFLLRWWRRRIWKVTDIKSSFFQSMKLPKNCNPTESRFHRKYSKVHLVAHQSNAHDGRPSLTSSSSKKWTLHVIAASRKADMCSHLSQPDPPLCPKCGTSLTNTAFSPQICHFPGHEKHFITHPPWAHGWHNPRKLVCARWDKWFLQDLFGKITHFGVNPSSTFGGKTHFGGILVVWLQHDVQNTALLRCLKVVTCPLCVWTLAQCPIRETTDFRVPLQSLLVGLSGLCFWCYRVNLAALLTLDKALFSLWEFLPNDSVVFNGVTQEKSQENTFWQRVIQNRTGHEVGAATRQVLLWRLPWQKHPQLVPCRALQLCWWTTKPQRLVVWCPFERSTKRCYTQHELRTFVCLGCHTWGYHTEGGGSHPQCRAVLRQLLLVFYNWSVALWSHAFVQRQCWDFQADNRYAGSPQLLRDFPKTGTCQTPR